MRSAGTFALAALGTAFGLANAQDVLLESCPISALTAPTRYTRLHQIPTVAPTGDVSHKVVTPGGMVLDTPKMVAATDVLTIVARDPDALCFTLLTFARERHRCELAGVARKETDTEYLFREDGTAVRFAFLREGQIKVEPLETGRRAGCEPSGKIEQATYTVDPESR